MKWHFTFKLNVPQHLSWSPNTFQIVTIRCCLSSARLHTWAQRSIKHISAVYIRLREKREIQGKQSLRRQSLPWLMLWMRRELAVPACFSPLCCLMHHFLHLARSLSTPQHGLLLLRPHQIPFLLQVFSQDNKRSQCHPLCARDMEGEYYIILSTDKLST